MNKSGRPISESTGEFYDEENEEGDINGPTSPGLSSNKGIAQAGPGMKKPQGPAGVSGGPPNSGPSTIPKKKNFFRKGGQPPYEVVPIMRPIVLIGPALKGYDITDMMQKAVIDFLKRHFENRLIVSRISTDISIAKRVGTLQNIDSKKGAMDKNRGRQISTLLEVQQELERIFDLASTMQLVVLDCDTVNHPGQVLKTSLAPIVIYIKIGSIRVLQKLIKTRDKDQKKNAGVQVAAAEKLLLCPPENFDLVIDQNTLEAACDALETYLENYWSMTHPPVQNLQATKMDKLFSNQDKQNHFTPQHPPSGPLFGPEGEILSSQVPMHPGRPGVMSMSAFALHAGFSAHEISALAGARSGWPGAYPDPSLGQFDSDNFDNPQTALVNGRPPLTTAGRTMINDSSDARAKALMIVQKQQQINNQEQAKQIHLVNAPGLHQVQGGAAFGAEGGDTPIVFQSRSARQAKQREVELERARKEIEAQLTGKKRRNRNNPIKSEPL